MENYKTNIERKKWDWENDKWWINIVKSKDTRRFRNTQAWLSVKGSEQKVYVSVAQRQAKWLVSLVIKVAQMRATGDLCTHDKWTKVVKMINPCQQSFREMWIPRCHHWHYKLVVYLFTTKILLVYMFTAVIQSKGRSL